MRWSDPLLGNARKRSHIADITELCGRSLMDGSLTSGQPIEDWPPDAWLAASQRQFDGEPDDVLACRLFAPVFSSRLRALLDELGVGDLQYLPVDVRRSTGDSVGTFYVVNVLTHVQALDLKRSQYTLYPDDYFDESRRGLSSGIWEPVVRAAPLMGHHVVRLREFRMTIIVSELVKEAFETHRCTGWDFRELDVEA